MKFVYPEFLWTFFALAIPIIIHLFNFKKYKVLYFSSLKFIKQVDQQTRSTQKLKHLLVLFLRLLAFSSLILAFAQPYLPVENNFQKGGKPLLAIYLDNSFSMTAKGTEGELLSEAREMSRKMINKASLETRILLCTNLLDGIERRLLTKSEAIDYLDKIEPSPLSRKLEDVINWQKNYIDQENQTHQKIGARQFVLFSDFQNEMATLQRVKSDQSSYFYPVCLSPQEKENLYIDSIWFSSPIFKIGQNNELNVRIVNGGTEDLTNAEMHAEIGSVKRDVFLDIPANSKAVTVLNYTEKSSGYKSGKVSINDKQLFWDDDFYFSYFVDSETNVLIINGEDQTSSISQVLNLEPYYKVKTIDQNTFTLNQLNAVDLTVLNGVNEIPSGMTENLVSFSKSGGTIALFPGSKCNIGSWNGLLGELNLPNFGNVVTSGTRIDKLIYDDPFFTGMFEKKKENLNLPSVTKAYQTNSQTKSSFYNLINLQNGQALLLRSQGVMNSFLFTSSLHASFGTFMSDALFPSIILRIAEMSQRRTPISLTIGKEAYFPLYKKQMDETPVHLMNGETDFIPQIQKEGLISYISISGQEALEVLKAGTYSIVDEKKEGLVSINYSRSESTTETLDRDGIVNMFKEAGIKNVTFNEITNGQSNVKIDLEKPYEYWKLLLIVGLLFLLSESVVLKLWK